MSKYVDADEVFKMIHELPGSLKEYDELMKEKPKFNKKEDEFDFIREKQEELYSLKASVKEESEKRIEKIDRYLKILRKCKVKKSDSLNVVVFKMYLQLNHVSKVADIVNKLGFRVSTNSKKGCRKFCSNDITEILKTGCVELDEELVAIAQHIHECNYKGKRWY